MVGRTYYVPHETGSKQPDVRPRCRTIAELSDGKLRLHSPRDEQVPWSGRSRVLVTALRELIHKLPSLIVGSVRQQTR